MHHIALESIVLCLRVKRMYPTTSRAYVLGRASSALKVDIYELPQHYFVRNSFILQTQS